MKRLDYDATTEEAVIQYFQTRHYQLSSCGFSWDHQIHNTPLGYFTQFIEESTQKQYYAFYVLKQHRGKGLSKKIVHNLTEVYPIITINDCKVVDFLTHEKVPFRVIDGSFNLPEYKLVESQYGDGQAKRSKIWFMNHIDEGMIILNYINSNIAAKAAFCLHPLLQIGEDLSNNFQSLAMNPLISKEHFGLALEYRNIANQYLSNHYVSNDDNITLSPLKEVNDMLIADKVQNYKDFLLYHKGTHPRSDILENYFKNWLKKLNCEDTFEWFINYSQKFQSKTILHQF